MLTFSNVWKINGQPIYAPSLETQVDYESLADENSGRSDDGVMHIKWIRRKMCKVYLKYPAMTAEELAYMLRLVQGNEYTLTYVDPYDNAIKTIDCYTSNSSMKLYNAIKYGGMFIDVTFNCIEK